MNLETVHYANILFGAGIIVLQVFALVAIFLLVFGSKENKYLSFIKKYFIEIGFLVSLSTLLVSIFYSEIVGYLPCKHCWIQRIFMFPQTFLFGVAWLRKDRNVLWYSLPLLLAGLLDAFYLTYIYYFNPNSAPCDASGVSCVQSLVSEFGGYITIPTLALSGFLILLTLLAVAHFYKKSE
jgi:disulfide bond formation protein DsbB